MNKVIRSVTQVLPRKYPQSSDETHQYRFDHQQRNKIQVKNKQQCIENVCTSIYLIFSESKHRKCMMAEQETTNPSKKRFVFGNKSSVNFLIELCQQERLVYLVCETKRVR